MSQISVALHSLCIAAFLAVLIYAALSDIRTLEIPNWTSVLIASVFFPAGLIAELPIVDIALHYGGAAGVFIFGVILFSRGWVGGGDVKLLAAVCVWWSFDMLGQYLIYMALCGGALALLVILARHLPILNTILPWRRGRDPADQAIPYGAAITFPVFLLFERIPVLPSELLDFLRL